MASNPGHFPFDLLARQIEGDLFFDQTWRMLYATDASVYRELPAAVCRPKNNGDLKKIIAFCNEHALPIVPRAAGTSLAGQVVGHGLVVDFSRYMTRILELNVEERWVRVEPGVILDELNRYLAPHGLFFGPETSTSNRCMMAGMVANNSCGSHSLVYGSTRDHTKAIRALLADGSEALFEAVDHETFRKKCIGNSLENRIYSQMYELLSKPENQEEIRQQYPDPRLRRRNTGYALDLLLKSSITSESAEPFNFCKLLAGSEGSLALFTEITFNLVPLPPPEQALVCVHLNSVEEALRANLIALRHGPVAVELIDNKVLECTKANITQRQNRFFVKGDPGAILVVEFAFQTREEILQRAAAMETEMHEARLGFHFPAIFGKDINRVWALRKAGLGVLSNTPGDAKPVAVIEDAAVHVEALPQFIDEHNEILRDLNLQCVYYAHIGTGELHLRPVLDLKNPADVERFHKVALETALLVKRYRGSLSGEHGDGRLRGEFIPLMLGEKVYAMLQQVKKTWDPHGLFNPGKITDTPSMKTFLRYRPGHPERKLKTFFNYHNTRGFLRAVEQCNGSGDCRKPATMGGVMCPSYHATLNETDTTRGRANVLREIVTNSGKKNPFDHQELLQVLDLCLACKGCKAECPSNVDMGRYKSEVLQQYYLTHGIPFRAQIIAAFAEMNRLASLVPALYNGLVKNRITGAIIKNIMGFSLKRSMPLMQKITLKKWAARNLKKLNEKLDGQKKVWLFCDEFTNYNDTQTGINAILLLHGLGYNVEIPEHAESGRAAISKGLLKKAASLAQKNVTLLHKLVSENEPLIGIEPSAILSFRDEYPDLCTEALTEAAVELSRNTLTIEEFICREHEAGRIDGSLFSAERHEIYFHGHCHQKALSKADYSLKMLHIPPNNHITSIECGCCGMAGSFGYEKKHFELSMQIAELKLFPAIRQAPEQAIISASGTSCRHQILDGTGRRALHPVDVLIQSLRKQ
ncbi:MAG: FAD-binding protein [Bacteroidales bacterium]|nr:FAD-binding protein [Bacteroidales bacterium]